ncbi:hypothetical protein F4805DRAFT_409571 [Annulohypoxylon moriforme]|nr:hypothetical protein F4805DRAFT_409571 [Annulohypoxylon moriforme]
MNIQATIAFARKRRQKVYIFLSQHTLRCPQKDRDKVLQEAFQVMDNSALKIPAYLPLTKDMPVSLTENLHQGLKLVNGAEYTVKEVVPNPEAGIYMLSTDIFIITEPPISIFVESANTQAISMPGITSGLIPLFPTKVYASKENKSFVRSRPFDRQGFTLTPTFAITEFKAQGQTLPKAFLSLTSRQNIRKGSDFTATYVQLSRVVSLEGLRLLSTINKEHWMSLKLSTRMNTEIERLIKLDEKTMARYEATQEGSRR